METGKETRWQTAKEHLAALGVDVEVIIRTMYKLGLDTGESRAKINHEAALPAEHKKREENLRQRNQGLVIAAERVARINGHLMKILMEEHHFLHGPWLGRMIGAAKIAGDKDLVERLNRIQRRLLAYGGPRRRFDIYTYDVLSRRQKTKERPTRRKKIQKK